MAPDSGYPEFAGTTLPDAQQPLPNEEEDFIMGVTHRSQRLVSSALVAAAIGVFSVQPLVAQETDEAEYQFLFVQTAASGGFDGTKLTLENLGPTILFTDRPQRVTGHMKTAYFVSQWGVGKDSFKEDPPNAAFSIYSKDALDTAVVELSNPALDGTTLSYDVKLLKGELPDRFGESTLFIDILGVRRRSFAAGALAGAEAGRAAAPQTVTEPTHSYTTAPPPTTSECAGAQQQLLAAQTEQEVNLATQKVKVICGK